MLLARPSPAQHLLTLTEGDRIRITLATSVETPLDWAPRRPFVGVFERVHSGTLTMRHGDRELRIPVAAIHGVDVQQGVRTNAWHGAAIGAALGGIGMGIASYASNEGCRDYAYCMLNTQQPAILGVALGVAGGGLVGLGAGALIRTPRWVAVALPLAATAGATGSAGVVIRLR